MTKRIFAIVLMGGFVLVDGLYAAAGSGDGWLSRGRGRRPVGHSRKHYADDAIMTKEQATCQLFEEINSFDPNIERVRSLISSHGANVHALDSFSRNLVHCIAMNRKAPLSSVREVIDELQKHKVDFNFLDKWYCPPLYYALSEKGKLKAVATYLLASGANIEVVAPLNNYTILFRVLDQLQHAWCAGSFDRNVVDSWLGAIRWLLENKANPWREDISKKSFVLKAFRMQIPSLTTILSDFNLID
ncbi:hypothetical protein K2X40_00050 [Candidatus Babeliales bacterium]|nr:hypothetical protein [Candidatus Babeliales bacterium]